jgi:hypothetical protein
MLHGVYLIAFEFVQKLILALCPIVDTGCERIWIKSTPKSSILLEKMIKHASIF